MVLIIANSINLNTDLFRFDWQAGTAETEHFRKEVGDNEWVREQW